MTNSIFLLTIGPVQGFIAEARKLRDLHAGSFLLSYIMKKIVNKIQEEPTVTVVFPLPGYDTMPNRIVCKVEPMGDEEQNSLGINIEAFAKKTFIDIAHKVKEKHSNVPLKAFNKEVDEHLECFWVFQDYTDYMTGYSKALVALEQVKQLRNFSYTKYPSGRACSLSHGKRALFAFSNTTRGMMNEHIKLLGSKYDDPSVKESEALCAVSFVKRFLADAGVPNYNANFPSIEDIIGQNSPSLYYAAIKFDGDSMGKVYSESRLKQGVSEDKFHSYLSEALMEFANEVRREITPDIGVTVFAGGEDFMGIVKRECMMPVLQHLRNKFSEIVDISNYVSDGKTMTFSAGVVIAHKKEPLSEVLKVLGESEKYAKATDDTKDAISVAVIKHSGENFMTRMKFGERCQNLDTLQEIVKLLKDNHLPMSFAYKLQESMQQYISTLDGDTKPNSEIILAEINRLFKVNSGKALRDEEMAHFGNLYSAQKDLQSFIDWLKVCIFVQREVN